jgi:phospholipid/cholesterol/gamma-HCH transport system permease protein
VDKSVRVKRHAGQNMAKPVVMWELESITGILKITIGGRWQMSAGIPAIPAELLQALDGYRQGTVQIDCDGLEAWDSALPVFLRRIQVYSEKKGLRLQMAGLSDALSRLLRQANITGKEEETGKPIQQAGIKAVYSSAWYAQLYFIGQVCLAFAKVVRVGNKQQWNDLGFLLYNAGPGALPIVTLISFLVGMILAFIGAMQLRLFGAQLYIADLVSLGMAREMGAMMTAIIVAGRSGAAYAAELGAMRANEEIDAIKTLGLNPIELLVVPRIVALMLVTPLLCVYADFMGILGGALVVAGLFDISMLEYFNESRIWLVMDDFLMGVGKSWVFAGLIALAGCMRGMQCGSRSSDVGWAATSAVVTSIVWVVVADAVLTVLIATVYF